MSAHFKQHEFSSPGVPHRSKRVPVPAKYQRNLSNLMAALEIIRASLGRPVRIISGYRTAEYNALNKGRASKSLHLIAQAADVRVKGASVARVYWTIHRLRAEGLIPSGGLACYATFVHYDIRGRNAAWRAAPRRPKGI